MIYRANALNTTVKSRLLRRFAPRNDRKIGWIQSNTTISMENLVQDERVLRLKRAIRDIPDFPKPGILFKDITPLLKNSSYFRDLIDLFCLRYKYQSIDRKSVV